jgi:hypothetical protein
MINNKKEVAIVGEENKQTNGVTSDWIMTKFWNINNTLQIFPT